MYILKEATASQCFSTYWYITNTAETSPADNAGAAKGLPEGPAPRQTVSKVKLSIFYSVPYTAQPGCCLGQ